MHQSVHDVPPSLPLPSTSTRSPHVTTIKKDCCTSIGSHLSLSLLRVRMVVSLPFPVLFKVEIRLQMNLERCPLEIKLIILLQVIQDKINMFQTWDNVSAFLSKGIFFPSKSLVCFFQLTYFTDALPSKERNFLIHKWTNHMIDKKSKQCKKVHRHLVSFLFCCFSFNIK